MPTKPGIAMVGAGNLAGALAASLHRAGYAIEAVTGRSSAESRRKARRLAREVGGRSSASLPKDLRAEVVWICVPDGEIAHAAESLAKQTKWEKRVALHSSGALSSDVLGAFRQRGAAVASVHPLMTFVRGSRPALQGVSFAIEGDAAAVRVAHRIVKDLGGHGCSIRKRDKAAYHAWGTFVSPLLTALLVITERVAAAAGVGPRAAKRRMLPIVRQTVENYAAGKAADAFSGPIIRGDVDTVRQHLRALRKVPGARDVYRSLAFAALHYLPGKNKATLAKVLGSEGK